MLKLLINAYIFPDLFVVLDGLNFVANQFLFNLSQLLLMFNTLRVLVHSVSLCFLLNLLLKLTLHLLALLVKSLCLIALLHIPLVIVVLHRLIPLSIGHADHLTMVTLNDLLVNINQESTRCFALGVLVNRFAKV